MIKIKSVSEACANSYVNEKGDNGNYEDCCSVVGESIKACDNYYVASSALTGAAAGPVGVVVGVTAGVGISRVMAGVAAKLSTPLSRMVCSKIYPEN